ncbi:hypothetical protein RB597_009086 [Gaeumannomyces tritici]
MCLINQVLGLNRLVYCLPYIPSTMSSLQRPRAPSLHAILFALLVLCSLQASAAASPAPADQQEQQTTPRPRCKAVPGTAAWPPEAAWRALNESTGGRLIRPAPPGAVCHPGQAGHDEAACARVRAAWPDRELHVSDPVSTMSDNWNNDTCLPDPAYPCSGRGYPVFVVNATTAEHVRLGVKFAQKHNVRLVVKNTGHDFVGRSVAPNALSIWTHHMKEIQRGTGAFKPKGCGKNVEIKGNYITVGGGMQMAEAYSFTDGFNETIVGGGGMTVGVGGWVTGAGHGLLSPTYGLGVDQVLEMEVVTPAGDVRTLNECVDRDLFWAMRGGGGSTFGILTSVTMKTHPTPRMPSLSILIVAPPDSPTPDAGAAALPDLAAYVLSELPRLSAAGAAGYLQVLRRFPDPREGQPAGQVVTGVTCVLTMPYGTPEALAAAWAPVAAHVGAAWPGVFFALVERSEDHAAWWSWFQEHYDTNPAGGELVLGSWLLDGRALAADRNATAAAFGRFLGGGSGDVAGTLLNFVGGRGVMEARPRGGGAAVLPAWRRAYLHPITAVQWPPLNSSAKAAALSALLGRVAGLRELAPDMGAYMNEANPYEPNWQDAFWGANYARLRSIKRSVDPDDVLWCHPCVGNEGWEEVDGQLCRV